MILSPDEHRVVSVARALVDRPAGPVRSLLQNRPRGPDYLTGDARFLIREALAGGWVEVLARAGGWRRDRAGERLWHRHRGVEMSFSLFAPQLCRRLASSAGLEAAPETAGDRLLCLLAARLAAATGCPPIVSEPAIAGSWLVQIAYADHLAHRCPDVEIAAPALDDPAERLVLDGLGSFLARRLVAIERRKSALGDLGAAAALGRIQRGALAGLGPVIDRHPELAAFALEAAAAIAGQEPDYARSLGPGSIAERAAARSGAAAFIRGLEAWRSRADAARSVRFFEDDYDRSQRLLRLWETLGDRRHARLAARADELESAGQVQQR